MFFDYSPITLNDKFTIPSHYIMYGMAFVNRIINVDYLGWCPVTMSPVESNIDGYLESPIPAIKYYNDRGISDLRLEHKRMGSRVCIYYDTNELKIYSRNCYDITDILSDKEYNLLLLDLTILCDTLGISGVVLDTEMEPWTRLSKGLITEDFLIPLASYFIDNGFDDNFNNTDIVIKNFIKDKNLEFYVFDIVAIQINGIWKSNNNIEPLSFYFKDDVFSILKNVASLNIGSDFIENEDINQYFIEITKCKYNTYFLEGIVIKPNNDNNRQLLNDFILPPYLKVRGKDYLRIIYGINYDKDEHIIKQLERRNLKRKRVQSVQEYMLNLMIHKKWIEYKNNKSEKLKNELLRLVAGFIGLKEHGAKSTDATL